MKKENKFSYLGYTYLSVPHGWISIIEEMLVKIDKEVRPWFIPLWFANLVNELATNGSVVYVKSWFWYKILNKITKGIRITDIKDKYAGIRVYGYFNDDIDKIVEWVEDECEKTCEVCGSRSDVKVSGKNWFYNLCIDCRLEKGIKITKTDEQKEI